MIGLVSLALILVIQLAASIPGVLLAVVARSPPRGVQPGDHGVSLVGDPFRRAFLPHLAEPGLRSAALVAGALGIALVSLTDTISTASSLPPHRSGGRREPGDDRNRRRERRRRLLPGLPVSTSGSRTAVAEQAGAKRRLGSWRGDHHPDARPARALRSLRSRRLGRW